MKGAKYVCTKIILRSAPLWVLPLVALLFQLAGVSPVRAATCDRTSTICEFDTQTTVSVSDLNVVCTPPSPITQEVRLIGAVKVNSFDGTADLDETAMRGAFIDALGPEEGDVWASEFATLVRDGFAVLQEPEPSGKDGAVFPWRLLVQPRRPEIFSPLFLTTFGIGPGVTPSTTRAFLTKRFPNVPASVLDEQNLERLSQIALFNLVLGANQKWSEDFREVDSALTITIKPGGGSIETPPSSSAIVDTLACISKVTVKLQWWGPEVCFDERCGRVIAAALQTGMSGDIEVALTSLVTVGTVAAGGGALGPVLDAFGLYTAAMILANITARGVCLQALWSVTGGFVWWARGI